MSGNLMARFRVWVVIGLAVVTVGYAAVAVWVGLDEVGATLATYQWWTFGAALLLTLVNYLLRFVKWHYLLGRLGVSMPLWEDLLTFVAGLSMAISPGKVGEMLKPYVVRARTGTPMTRTVPALVTERLTDAIAMLILAGFGISTYMADQLGVLVAMSAAVATGLGILASKRLSLFVLQGMKRIPLVGRAVPTLEGMYLAMRVCVAPVSFLVTMVFSLIAWGAECVAYLIVLLGLGVAANLDVSVFIYAAATIIGAPSPGGAVVTDGGLIVMGQELIAGITYEQAAAAAVLVRTATLWFGVGLGAIALTRVAKLLGGDIDLGQVAAAEAEGTEADEPEPQT